MLWCRAQVCVGVKKRLLVLGWATGGFVAKRDVALNDQPRAMLMPTPDSCILAYKYVHVHPCPQYVYVHPCL